MFPLFTTSLGGVKPTTLPAESSVLVTSPSGSTPTSRRPGMKSPFWVCTATIIDRMLAWVGLPKISATAYSHVGAGVSVGRGVLVGGGGGAGVRVGEAVGVLDGTGVGVSVGGGNVGVSVGTGVSVGVGVTVGVEVATGVEVKVGSSESVA